MKPLAFAAVFVVLATVGHAEQAFVTVKSKPLEAWWLSAEFHPRDHDVRGIPVAQIRPNWCKASEYTRELIPKELLEEGGSDTMKEVGLSFSVTGTFDRSKIRQAALVGVYQTCGGQKGSFLLVIDEDTRRVRFVEARPGKAQFAVLAQDKNDIVILYCMECDAGGRLRWNAKAKKFAWAQK